MKWTALFLCLGFYQLSFAQAYNRLLGAENYWYVTTCNFGCITDFYWAKEDTVINNKTYKFLDGFHYNKNMLLREDTAAKKVFFRPTDGPPPIKEDLLYDFSLLPGDSIEIVNPMSPLPNDQGLHIVDSINIRVIKDGPHRIFYLSEIGGSHKTLWVEGIGSLCLINTPGGLPDVYGIGDLSCFFKDGVQVYESDSLLNGSCDTSLMVMGHSLVQETADKIQLFPNPSKGSIMLNFGKEKTNITLVLFNELGQVIQSNHYQSKSFIELELPIARGFYFLQVSVDGKVFSKKVLRE